MTIVGGLLVFADNIQTGKSTVSWKNYLARSQEVIVCDCHLLMKLNHAACVIFQKYSFQQTSVCSAALRENIPSLIYY